MKYHLTISTCCALALLSCKKEESTNMQEQVKASVTQSVAQKQPVTENNQLGSQLNPQLQSVASHLDTHGAHFSVTDISGDLDALCGFIDDLLETIPKGEVEIPEGISIRETLKKSGLDLITAKGESSRLAGDHWHNRTFYATRGHRKGILSLLGGKGARYTTPDFAPANTDLLIETQINLKELKSLSEQIANSFGGEAEEEFTETMKQKFLGAAMTAGDMFGKFDVRLSLAVTVNGETTWKAEEDGTPFPTVDMVMLLDGAAWLWDEYGKAIEQNGLVREEGSIKYITSKEPIPTPMGTLNPIIVIDSDKDQIWFALHETTLKACRGESPKLWKNPEFKAAMHGLPQKGNALLFVSSNFCNTLTSLPIENLESEEVDSKKIEEFYDKLTGFITRSKSGYAWALANEDDGIVIAANAPFSNKNYSATSMMAVYGAMVPTLFIGANIYKKGADRAACILNIRNIHQATRAHQSINGLNIGAPLDPNELFGPGKYLEQRPTCPLGHQYTLSKTIPVVGTTAASCEHDEHHPDDTGGW